MLGHNTEGDLQHDVQYEPDIVVNSLCRKLSLLQTRITSDSEQEDQVWSADEEFCANATVDVKGERSTVCKSEASKRDRNAKESDQHRLMQRQKQINFGKNTAGYQRYRLTVPKHKRMYPQHPQTPEKTQVCSKRSWDGQIRKWRRQLHAFDPSI